MSLRLKFIFAILSSILFVALVNILAFWIFYSSYFKIYLLEKQKTRTAITEEYINEVFKKQTIDEIDELLVGTELGFYELLEKNDGEIPLDTDENIDIVVTHLVKSGLAPKYIEEVIPDDNFRKTLEAIRSENTPESRLVQRILYSLLFTNIIALTLIILSLAVFVRKTLRPVKEITKDIRALNRDLKNANKSVNTLLNYKNKNDEIGLLVQAINNLGKRLSIQNTIRTRLLADISHELKTPITSIQTYLEGISDGVIELNEKNLGSISYEMKRLINLVNTIMDYEKFDRSNFELDSEHFDIIPELKNVAETHKTRLAENKQRIKVTGLDSKLIEADKDLFMQMTHNLVGNFMKYAGKNTVLTINVTKNYIDYTDNGKGVKTSEIPFLVEKFYQGNTEKSGNIEERGIGVGLSIVTKIIESHDWKYEIHSEKNKGFSFKVYL